MTGSGTFKQIASGSTDELLPYIQAILGDALGEGDHSRQKTYTGFEADDAFLMAIRNQGLGGKHVDIQKSTDGSIVLQILDNGLTTTQAITSSVAPGAPPFVVDSDDQVDNLNVEFLQGFVPSDFATAAHNHDPVYVNVTGDTMTDALVIYITAGGGNDAALFLKHHSTTGQFSLGATNAADPSLVARDHSGNQMLTVNPSGATYALDVNPEGVVLGALNAARFTGDVLITTDLGVNDIVATGGGSFGGDLVVNTSLLFADVSASVVGINTATPNAAYEFDVNGNAHINDDLDVDGDTDLDGALDVAGASTLRSAVTITGSNTLSVGGSSTLSGGFSAGASSTITGGLTVVTGGFTLSSGTFQLANVNHGFFGATPIGRPTVSGSRGGNAALADLCSELANLGLINDSTS